MFELVRSDMQRYRPLGGWHRNAGFWVGTQYRFAHWARQQIKPLRWLFVLLARIVGLPCWLLLHVEIPSTVKIGPGLCLIHARDIMVDGAAVIGANCLIFHEVTIGTGPTPGIPVIGDQVDIYVGARVLGGIKVGNGARIGANCVITKDVPDGTLVAATVPRYLPRELAAKIPGAREPAPEDGRSAQPPLPREPKQG